MRFTSRFSIMVAAFMEGSLSADGQTEYRRPPQAVADILDAPAPPAVSVNPTRDAFALVESERYPPIADLAEPMLRLAGLRFNPKNDGPARPPRVVRIAVRRLDGGRTVDVPLPPGKVSGPDWSPDGRAFALTAATADAVRLYVVELAGDRETGLKVLVRPVAGLALNAVLGDSVRWMPGSKSLLVRAVPSDRGAPPQAPPAPPGPTVQETSGKAGPVRTYQDLLQNAHDEDLFEHHATGRLAVVDVKSLAVEPLGGPGVLAGAEPSPDGNYVLVTRVRRPYSFLYAVGSFPKVVEVWDRRGRVVHRVADLALQDRVPIEGVPTGPRGATWVPNRPCSLMWVEARDDGDPRKKVPHRDELFVHPAPFDGPPQPAGRVEHRFAGISFYESGDRVLLRDYDRDRRWSRTLLATLGGPEAGRKVVFDRSAQDRYLDPGTPLLKSLPTGERVLRTSGGRLLLAGAGAGPEGDRPFLDLFDPATGGAERVFQSRADEYAVVAAVVSDDASRLVVRRESQAEPPNYFLRDRGRETKFTDNHDPAPFLRGVKKHLVTTRRPDGVGITFTLYLPPGRKDGERLPTVFWAYPKEFNSADTAGQVSGSAQRFTSPVGVSHLFFLTQGYAVMDEVGMPVVGPSESANDTFVEQMVASEKAAIDKAVEMGAVDRDRMGIGGHSYGAFMAANLLAHSDLFRAGIARSGAYNRTLTPFGFQNERRTFWEAADVYARMSPFHNAHKIDEPILLIHGAADDNPGTFPLQSERLFQAIRGNGGTARLVVLPHESHAYSARESIGHVLAEQIDWFDKYVKNAGPRLKK